jgi:Ni,Fe-hydrogenase III component G
MDINIKDIDIKELLQEVVSLHENGQRFVTASAYEQTDGSFSIIYHFDKDYELTNLRINFAKGEVIPSISPIYFAAFLVENEIQDLYGIKFKNLKVDFGGTLLIDNTEDTIRTPFCRYTVENKTTPKGEQK